MITLVTFVTLAMFACSSSTPTSHSEPPVAWSGLLFRCRDDDESPLFPSVGAVPLGAYTSDEPNSGGAFCLNAEGLHNVEYSPSGNVSITLIPNTQSANDVFWVADVPATGRVGLSDDARAMCGDNATLLALMGTETRLRPIVAIMQGRALCLEGTVLTLREELFVTSEIQRWEHFTPIIGDAPP